MPAEVLRGRVEDDVGAELERILEGRRGDRVVDKEPGWGEPALGDALADRRRGGGDIGQLEQRIRGALEPHEPRSCGQLLPERVRPDREVRESRLARPTRAMDALEVAVG